MPFRRLPLALAALLAPALLSGCAPARVPWANPARPKAQWAQDWTSCRRHAEEAVVGYQSPEPVTGPSPLDSYDRAQARSLIDAQVAQCMRDQGYEPRPRGE